MAQIPHPRSQNMGTDPQNPSSKGMNLKYLLLSLGRAINKAIVALMAMLQNCMLTIFPSGLIEKIH